MGRIRRSVSMVSAAGVLAAHAAAGTPPQQQRSIRWADGTTEPLATMTAAQCRAQLTRLSARAGASHVIVRLARPPSAADRAELAVAGLTIGTPLGGAAYFAALRPGADAGVLARRGLESLAAIPTQRKLHPDLAAGVLPAWAVSLDDAAADPRLAAMVDSGQVRREALTRAGLDPRVAVVVVFHDGVDSVGAATRLAAAVGGEVASDALSINAAVVHLRASRLQGLASDDEVMWVEPPLPPLTDNNAENRALTGVDALAAAPSMLTGAGVRVLVFDGGRMFAHGDVADRLSIGSSDTAPISAHATHVGGTIGGDGTGQAQHRGMAPGVDLVSYGLEQPGGLQAGFLYTDPADVEADYAEAISLHAVDLANNSIGTNVASNGYPCHWTGDYGATSALIDAIVRGSLGRPLPVVWANGNERSRPRCLGDDAGNHGEYFSTAPPACAKNHITVGAVHADTDEITWFSSWGPTDDGRIKPDVSAPGCQAGGDQGVTSLTASGPASYGVACGTSMAAPTVTGIVALLLEDWRRVHPGRPDPMNATIKALLANTAQDRGPVGPDFQYGFGSVRAAPAAEAIEAGSLIEGSVTHTGTHRFSVVVMPGEPTLRVTAAWDDAPAAPNMALSLVNDLDLRVIAPSGEAFLPWTLDPANPSAPAVRTAPDRLNNIEQVVVDAPAPGIYTVEVVGTLVADGHVQPFGAVSTGQVLDCSRAATIGLDATVVPCEGVLTVTVRDCDGNTSPGALDAIGVTIHSDTDPAGFPLLLLETGADTAVFSGTFSFGPAGADLAAGEGDTLSARYLDEDDGTGAQRLLEAAAVADCTGPVISAPVLRDLWHDSVTVEVRTDEPARVRLRYGASPGSLQDLDFDHPMAHTHRLPLAGLTGLTPYYYAVIATDAAGNESISGTSDDPHFFRTPNGPEPVHQFLTDDADPAWSTTGLWAFGQPAGLKGDPASGFTGSNVYGYNLLGYYEPHIGVEFLTSAPIDMTGVVETRLEFQRWLGVEPDVAIAAELQARAGGGDWQVVWEHSGGRQSPTEWTHVSYDISAIADGQPDLQLRWTIGPSGTFADECGWNIDDIVLTGVVLARLCPADLDANGVLNVDDLDAFVAAFFGADLLADLTGDGTLNVDDVDTFVTIFLTGCP